MTLPPRVVLHVGMAKAGSTALQNFMADNQAALLAKGVLFPLSILRRTNPLDPLRTPGHLDLIRQIGPDIRPGAGLSPLFAECAAAPSAQTLFLSIENLFNIESDRNVARLAGLLAGCEVRLVAVLREPREWIAARYYEVVTAGLGNETRPIDRYVEAALDSGALNYARRLDFLAATFRARSVAVFNHRDLTGTANILATFLAELGVTLPVPEEVARRRVNVSLAYPEAIEAHRRLNPFVRSLPRERRFAFAATMKARCAALAGEGRLRPGGAAISTAVRGKLLAAVAGPCRAVSERWFGGRPFGPDADWARASPAPLDRALTAALQDFGFAAFLEESEAAARAGRRRRAGFPFETGEIRCLHDAYAGARVILEYGSGASTLLAASLPGKFVLSVESDRDWAMRMQIRLAAAAPPSPAVIHHVELNGAPDGKPTEDPDGAETDGAGRYAAGIWDEPFFRHPDVVLVNGRFRSACLATVAARITRPVTLLFDDYPKRGRSPSPTRVIGRLAEFRLAPRAGGRAGARGAALAGVAAEPAK